MTARRKGPPRPPKPRRRRRRKSDAGAGASPEPPVGGTPAVRLLAAARRFAWVAAVVVGVAAFAASTWLFVLYPSEKGPGDGHTV